MEWTTYRPAVPGWYWVGSALPLSDGEWEAVAVVGFFHRDGVLVNDLGLAPDTYPVGTRFAGPLAPPPRT